MHINPVHLEDATNAGLAYLVRVEQLELLDALIEVVAQGDAVAPALDLPALRPELDINRVAGLEHPAIGAYVDGLFFQGQHGRFFLQAVASKTAPVPIGGRSSRPPAEREALNLMLDVLAQQPRQSHIRRSLSSAKEKGFVSLRIFKDL